MKHLVSQGISPEGKPTYINCCTCLEINVLMCTGIQLPCVAFALEEKRVHFFSAQEGRGGGGHEPDQEPFVIF